jgi:hypothetical protein
MGNKDCFMTLSPSAFSKAILLLTSFFAPIAYSASPNNNHSVKSNSSLFSHLPSLYDWRHGHTVVQLGGYWGTAGDEQNISIRYLRGNHYTVTSNTSRNGLFGLGYYVDGLDKDRFHLDYGINGFFLAKTHVSGEIVQEQLFTNLAYSYAIQHIPIFFGAKALVKNKLNRYNLTLNAGIGPNFMRLNHYQETPLNNFTIPDNGFSSHTQVAFAAMAGFGVRLNHFFGQAPLECGYRFFYLGQGQLHMNNIQLLSTVKSGNSFGNALLCSITV